MKYIALFITLLFCALVSSQAATASSLDVLTPGTVAQGEWVFYSFDLDSAASNDDLTFTVFPCFGAVDWYVRRGAEPTENSFDFRWEFPDSNDHDNYVYDSVDTYETNDNLDGVYYLGVYAHDDENHGESSGFNFYVGYANPTPFPDASGSIDVSQDNEGVVEINWPSSDTNNVEYCVYGHSEDVHDESDVELIHGSPCAVETEALLGCTTESSLSVDLSGESGEWHFDVVVRNTVTGFENSYVGVGFDLDSDNNNSSNNNSSNNNSSNNSSSAATLTASFVLALFALLFA